jgi:hypothetical protein
MKFLKRFNESKNVTEAEEETKLKKYFGIESEDVKDWVQDFLDEYNQLDFEVSIISDKHFTINFFDSEALNNRVQGYISRTKFPFSDDNLYNLKSILASNGLSIARMKQENGQVGELYYAVSGQYMSISIIKV